jgi:hypothetical protein
MVGFRDVIWFGDGSVLVNIGACRFGDLVVLLRFGGAEFATVWRFGVGKVLEQRFGLRVGKMRFG